MLILCPRQRKRSWRSKSPSLKGRGQISEGEWLPSGPQELEVRPYLLGIRSRQRGDQQGYRLLLIKSLTLRINDLCSHSTTWNYKLSVSVLKNMDVHLRSSSLMLLSFRPLPERRSLPSTPSPPNSATFACLNSNRSSHPLRSSLV